MIDNKTKFIKEQVSLFVFVVIVSLYFFIDGYHALVPLLFIVDYIVFLCVYHWHRSAIPYPLNVYKYIQKRYKYYDKKEGGYCAELYDDEVFDDAMKKFKLDYETIYNLYFEGSNEFVVKGKIDADKVREKKRKKLGKRGD